MTIYIINFYNYFDDSDDVKKKQQMIQFVNKKKNITQTDIWGKKFH